MFKLRHLNVFWLILISLENNCGDAQRIRSPASEFSRHGVVRPILHHAKTKREITSTRHKEGIHHPEVTMTLNIDGLDHVLDLQLNENLITQDHVIVYQEKGETVLHKPTLKELDICQYSGKVRGKKDSWVAVSTCDGVRGIIHDGKQMRYIQPAESNEIDSEHFLYEHSELSTNLLCGYNDGITNNVTYKPEQNHLHYDRIQNSRIIRYKRETHNDTEVRGPFNINKLSRFVELVLVVDNEVFRNNGESIATVHRQMKDLVNIVNSVYTPLNIFIALVGVVVWNEKDEIQIDEDGDLTLKNFLSYRKQLIKALPNDNAQLLTNQRFKGGVVGKVLKGPICSYDFSGAVITKHSEVIGIVATTMAHEMGHSFGMEHDTEADCKCPDEKCIMTGSFASLALTKWSSCSLNTLAKAFARGMDYCLHNKPKRLFESSTCGNGFVEPGEQCDCGLAGDAACAACCHPRACVLRVNATCATGECCDTTTCRPKAAGTECRAAERECDLPEYCSGHSEYCPRDVHKMDATPCAGDTAYCAGGSCRTHTDQCRLLWGFSGENSDAQCYISLNTKGDKKGNCGYRREDPTIYYKCSKEDALCGLLQCRHLNERLEFGMESVSTLSAVFINNNGIIIPCRTAMVDLGTSDPDPGFVPDGAKCGQDKSSTCGNGFVEPGEQCDCGLAGDAACAACCHPRACVLRVNATCATGECCDTTTCRPKAAGTECRAAERECDLPEYCSGHSEYCPRDVHKMDATPCAGDTAYCAGGSCRTHTDQCRLLWGFSGENSDAQCYISLNTKGDKKGNCGYRREDPTIYYKCSKEDALCGLLQCRHLNERLEFGMESVSTLSAVFINNNGIIIPCRTAMVDLGTSDPDPGFVPDGAKCGQDKSSTCGNGFVEPGEQCDCGLAGDAACAACCHPRACVLRVNATCATGECCDTTTCRPKAAGTECRAAERECDLPEYCSGHSEYCPRDVHKMDATPCAGDTAYCAGGSCRTHTDQCRLLWGFSGENSDAQCYISLNTKGDKKGNCGYRREDPTIYYKCSKEDALCGLLQCRHLNERLEFGMESVSTLSAVFINNNGIIIPCRTAMVDLGTSDPDPGFVPDGAKCGQDKMCLDHRCVSASALRAQLMARDPDGCRDHCSGHGVCNSEGHCYCDQGYAPPFCTRPCGGSVDSHPTLQLRT